ncbi:flagellar hook-length control protein FliK [Shouchella sp. 1P09AA]|uniref:flagellar hook-length control protein FliK n=1 Tax=unclassified Shouchella TaxID=2893065 RepID=UPI00399F67B0
MIQLLSMGSENRSSYTSSNGKHPERDTFLSTGLFAQAIAATLQNAVQDQESDIAKERSDQETDQALDLSKKVYESLLSGERVMPINDEYRPLQQDGQHVANTNQRKHSPYEQEEQDGLYNSVFGEESGMAMNANLDRGKEKKDVGTLDQGSLVSLEPSYRLGSPNMKLESSSSPIQKERLLRSETEEQILLNKDGYGSEEKKQGDVSLFLHTANESSHQSDMLSSLDNEKRETQNTYQQELRYDRQALLQKSQDKAMLQTMESEQEMDFKQTIVTEQKIDDRQTPVHKLEVDDKQVGEHVVRVEKQTAQKVNQSKSEQNQSQESSAHSSDRFPDINNERGIPSPNGDTQKHGLAFQLKEEGGDALQEVRSASMPGKQQEPVDSLLARQLLRILRAAKTTYTNDRQQQVMLKLHPESLGRVNIQFIQQAQGYIVRISAERPYAKEAIERSLPQLRQLGALQDTKVEVLQIEEELPEENEHHSQQEQDRKRQHAEQLEKKPRTNFKEWMAAILQTEVKQDDAN